MIIMVTAPSGLLGGYWHVWRNILLCVVEYKGFVEVLVCCLVSWYQGYEGYFCCHLQCHFGKRVCRAEMECDGTRKRTGGEVKGKKANGGGSQQLCTVSDTVYPAFLPLMRTHRLPATDWTDTPADINGLVRVAGKPNLVSARVPSRSVPALHSNGRNKLERLVSDF